MSFFKRHIKKIKDLGGASSDYDSTHSTPGNTTPSKTQGVDGSPGASTPVNGNTNGNGQTNGNGTNSTSYGNAIKARLNSLSAKDVTTVDERRQSREVAREERRRQSMDREKVKLENKKRQSLARIEDEKFIREGPPALTKLYRPFSMNMSKKWHHENRILFKNINWEELDGEILTFRARIHTLRRMSAKLVFIVFRQQTITIQGVLQSFKQAEDVLEGEDNIGTISERMVRSVEHYPSETIVVVHAKLRKAPIRVKNATIHDYEMEVYEVHKVGDLAENVPFTVYDAENINRDKEEDVDDEDDVGEAEAYGGVLSGDETTPVDSPRQSTDISTLALDKKARHTKDPLSSKSTIDVLRQNRSLPQRVRLNNRIIDLRTGPAQSIFRIQSGICNLFRSYLDTQGFIEIHTPKLQGGATESGASVFEVNYFGRPAFLAQSPQLAKQMCIAADFERVYEIGPVFRAEDSNTPRHLTEYTGLDLEMALEEHYHEALTIIDGMFKNLWKGIYERYSTEIELISHFYPHEKVLWLEDTPRIPFADGVRMLNEDGWVDDDGNPANEYEDLPTAGEKRLGALVREKFKTDYYILDKFPASARPFYTMPDPNDRRITNSFDIFMRGQEILSGGQRIHDATFLEKRMKELGVKAESMPEYIEGFKWGAPPHAGCGIGLERLTFLFLNLGNIRLASLFPRDPKSLPEQAKVLKLRHEDASTITPPWEHPEFAEQYKGKTEVERLQPLEKLIANYGDAANTSWLDTRYHVYRHPGTGAAQGFVLQGSHAIAVGEPLCAKSQYNQIISAFLQFLKDKHKGVKPLWLIIGPEMEEYLGEKFGWRTLGCIAEERIDPRSNNPTAKDKDLARKLRHADAEGVKEFDHPKNEPLPDDFKTRVDARVQDWQRNRKGTQVHLTEIRPWLDEEHRRYFYSQTSDGVLHAIVVMHQLSPTNGYQIKFSLEFPGAPSGTIESLILHSLKAIAASDPDASQVTFGTGAMPNLTGGRNLGKTKVKALKKAYEGINKQFKLTNKSEFREKMGVRNEEGFVAYPRGGLGASGISAIMNFLKEEG